MTDKGSGHPIARRVVTALATAAGVVALFLWCPLKALPPIVMVLSALVQLEFYQIAAKRGYMPVPRFGILLGTFWLALTAMYPGAVQLADTTARGVVILGPVLFLFSVYVLFRRSFVSPIGTIADFCGFGSQVELRIAFRARTGMSMRQWRKNHLG